MTKNTEISSAELEVMQILWQEGKALKVQDVCDLLPEGKWAYKTVATLLLRLEEKGAVKSEKEGKANCYTAVLNKENYQKTQTKDFIKKLYNGSVRDLAVSLFKSDDMTKEDIDEIRKMFDL